MGRGGVKIGEEGGARGRENREADQKCEGHSWRAKEAGAGRKEGHDGPEQRPRQDRLHRSSGEEVPGRAAPPSRRSP